MNGNTSGDGKTSPFGKNGGPMPGNDFTKNPAGSQPGGKGANFVEQPAGAGPTAAAPPDFTKGGKDAQKSGSAPVNPESAIKDKGQLVPLADVPRVPPARR